jgi:hypothetical protein
MAQPPGKKRKSFAERVAEVAPPVTISQEQLTYIIDQVILAVPSTGGAASGNIDGGTPDTIYGGLDNIDLGGI